MFSGGIFAHLIPTKNGQLDDVWTSYLQRLRPDALYIPASLVDLKSKLQKFVTGYVGEVDYGRPVSWRGSPFIQSLLAKRNPDGSPAACGPSWLVDVERSSEAPPVSELQRIARFGIVREIPIESWRFLGIRQQLRELIHIVPPASGQGLVDWLFGTVQPDPRMLAPPYLAQGGTVHSVITLNQVGIWPGYQSYPPERRDTSWSLANKLVVVGEGDSLEDACLVWNLRANRWPGLLPAWITPQQAEDQRVRRSLLDSAMFTQESPGPSNGGVNNVHLLSATVDTQEMARDFLCQLDTVGWTPTDWIHFIDRRHRRFFGRSKEAMTFSNGHASFVVNDDALPCSRPTEITVDVEIESYRPPPTHVLLSGTNLPHTGRFGEAVISLSCWDQPARGEEASLGYPSTFYIVRQAFEEAGLHTTFDRKAALTYGMHRILADEYSAHMVLRNHDVLDLLKITIESERATNKSERFSTPRGTPFGEFHRKLGSQKLASALISWLLRKRLVFRGLDLICRNCGTSAWYSLNEVGNQFRCVGCQEQQPFDRMPQDASWRYRVNQLLASALDQGVLQQVLAAYAIDLRPPSKSRAYVFPNVILSDLRNGGHVAEIDLFGFQDGEWLAAECKAWGSATKSELHALRRILDCLGGGRLYLVRASTSSAECDGMVDRVVIWDNELGQDHLIERDQLWDFLEET